MTDPHFRITEFSGCIRLSITIRKAKQRRRKPVVRTTKPEPAPSLVLVQLPLPFVD